MAVDTRIIANFTGAKTASSGINMSISAPLTELAGAVTILKLIGKSFTMGVQCEGEQYAIKHVIYQGMRIDREGCSRITFNVDPDSLDKAGLSFVKLAEWKTKNVTILLKGEKNGK